MKNLLAAFVLSLLAFNLHASCANPEAQFIGNVTDVKEDCSFKISFSRFNESVVCPLSHSEAAQTRFENPNCSLSEGDDISGYLIVNEGQIILDR